jgi:hypothetical protein
MIAVFGQLCQVRATIIPAVRAQAPSASVEQASFRASSGIAPMSLSMLSLRRPRRHHFKVTELMNKQRSSAPLGATLRRTSTRL